MKYRVLVLTEKEYNVLSGVIRNGYGDGDYFGCCDRSETQAGIRALNKYNSASQISKSKKNKITDIIKGEKK